MRRKSTYDLCICERSCASLRTSTAVQGHEYVCLVGASRLLQDYKKQLSDLHVVEHQGPQGEQLLVTQKLSMCRKHRSATLVIIELMEVLVSLCACSRAASIDERIRRDLTYCTSEDMTFAYENNSNHLA